MSHHPYVDIDEATEPLVLALDVGSTASRGALYDALGQPVGKRAKVEHAFTSSADGTSEIDADQVVRELTEIIDELVERADGHAIAGVALDTFASSMVVTDSDGRPLTGCMTYADSRPHAFVDQLREEVSEEELHAHTGTRVHTSYWPARLRWLRDQQTEVFESAAHFLSLGDYALRELTGTLATGTSSAAWAGMVDLATADWSDRMLELSGITRDQVAPTHDLDEPLEIDDENAARIAERWPELADAQWFAAIPDGLAANVGLGAADDTRMGGTAATSGALRVLVTDLPERIPGGLWCYRVSRERAIVGGALNDVGRAIDWALRSYGLGEDADAVLTAAPDTATPLVLPFFTGERSIGWAANARAVFTGVDAATSPELMYRAVIEGIAISYGRLFDQLRELAPDAGALHMGGSVMSEHPDALGIIADVLGIPIVPVLIKRSTLRGTALLALETLAADATPLAPEHEDEHAPDESNRAYYATRAERFERLYTAVFG